MATFDVMAKDAERTAARRVAELLSKPEHLDLTGQLTSNYVKKRSILEVSLCSLE